MCAFLECFHGWVWVSLTAENAFMGGSTFLEYIYGWVWVFVTVKSIFMGGYTFLNLFMGGCRCLWLFKAHLWVGGS